MLRAENIRCDKRTEVPADIKAMFEKPLYKNAVWGLRVIDLDTGEQVINLRPHYKFFVGSVRKVFTIGELLNEVGPGHRYNTPVYRHGAIQSHRCVEGRSHISRIGRPYYGRKDQS